MDWPITLALAAAFTGLTVLCGWRGARLPDPSRGPRLVPGSPQQVKDGDEVVMGKTFFKFVAQ